MATKTYKAIGTQVSLNLFINGNNYRVTFHPVSNYVAGQGGSELTTDNPSLQRALEENGNFGRLYWLKAEDGSLVKELPNVEGETPAKPEDEKPLDVVKVASIADAKTWLMDHKGWTPKSRVTTKGIVEAARSYGIVFEGID
jgi:hypothetical protein